MMELNKYELFRNGIYADYITASIDLKKLIQKLWPVTTQFTLERYGDANDGGYLIPNDLEGIAACFSPGVDVNASFEMDLYEKKLIKSHLADYSVDSPPSGLNYLSFLKKFIGAYKSLSYTTLDEWVRATKEFESGYDLILQMDIEGGEYASIVSVSDEVLSRFRIIVIEIHNIEAWGNREFFGIVDSFFKKILSNFWVVHNHPNNCCGIVDLGGVHAPRVFELTLLRKDRATPIAYQTDFPHEYDSRCVKDNDDIQLPVGWYWKQPVAMVQNIDARFLSDSVGVIHIGANTGQERDLYNMFGLKVLWVEALPDVYAVLEENIRDYPLQSAINALVADSDNQVLDFYISNNNAESSSIFDIKHHRQLWPDVNHIDVIKLTTSSFSTIIKKFGVDLNKYCSLVIDTQGSELLVLKGAGRLLREFKYIKLEAADFESYKDGCTLQDIKNYLDNFGFVESAREMFKQADGVGAYYNILFEHRILE